MSQKLIDGKKFYVNQLKVGKIVTLGEALYNYGAIVIPATKRGGFKVFSIKRGEHVHAIGLRGYRLHNSSLNSRNKSILPIFRSEIWAIVDAKTNVVLAINH